MALSMKSCRNCEQRISVGRRRLLLSHVHVYTLSFLFFLFGCNGILSCMRSGLSVFFVRTKVYYSMILRWFLMLWMRLLLT